ncbi:MAG: murein biosynthesis integral membrane protein MurJ [Sandaracinus sp.]|nr:murein biosynthesis integral membrane protein MurJ [Sandaracinus sp.]|tara:strand:+ start:68 stop:1654 length:1587 start_codon:yes stop_codon:yes gene_type:complete
MSGEPGSERGSIARRAGVVAAGTLASRILGAVRDAVIAASFAVAATDAFWLAFTIPNALRVVLGEGAVSGAFVPVLTEVREKEGPEAAKAFYARLSGTMLLLLAVVCLIGVVAAPGLVALYASGFRDDAELWSTTVLLARMVFPYIGLMGAAALATGALHAAKSFVAPAFAPALLNVAFIAAALLLLPWMGDLGLPGVAALAFGALVGGLLQLLAQLPALRRAGYLDRPRLGLRDPHVREAFGRLLPLFVGLGVYQLNVIASRQLASYLPEGAISYLFYAQRLVEIPQGMFALAIGTAALPTLAEFASRGEKDRAKEVFRDALRLSLFVALPSTVALGLLAEPTVAVLFGRGRFDEVAIAETAWALIYLAGFIWAVASVRTVVPMFHALGDTRSPVKASAANLVVFFAVALATMRSLKHAGLALAIGVAAAVQLFTLIFMLRRRVGRLGLRSVAISAARSSGAALVMGLAILGIARFGEWYRGSTPFNAVLLGVAVTTGAVVYLAAAKALGSQEVGALWSSLRRRRRR